MHQDKNYINNYMELVYIISTLNSYLLNGTRDITDWISTTTNFESMFRYYDNQDYNQIAVIDSITNGLRDININTLEIDLSSREQINSLNILCNKIKQYDLTKYQLSKDKESFIKDLVRTTNINFRGFNYSINSSESCYYRYIPPEKINF